MALHFDSRKQILEAARWGESDRLQSILQSAVNYGGNSAELQRLLDQSLLLAATWGHIPVVKQLLICGADPCGATDSAGANALHLAVRRGQRDVVQLLLWKLPRPWEQDPMQLRQRLLDAKDLDGMTPLAESSQHGRADLAEILLQAGANPNITCRFRRRPLDWATGTGNQALAQLLLRTNVDSMTTASNKNAFSSDVVLSNHPEQPLHPPTQFHHQPPPTQSSLEYGSIDLAQTFDRQLRTSPAQPQQPQQPARQPPAELHDPLAQLQPRPRGQGNIENYSSFPAVNPQMPVSRYHHQLAVAPQPAQHPPQTPHQQPTGATIQQNPAYSPQSGGVQPPQQTSQFYLLQSGGVQTPQQTSQSYPLHSGGQPLQQPLPSIPSLGEMSQSSSDAFLLSQSHPTSSFRFQRSAANANSSSTAVNYSRRLSEASLPHAVEEHEDGRWRAFRNGTELFSYPLNKPLRGHCLVMSNERHSDHVCLSDRTGTKKDVEKIQQLFGQRLGFKVQEETNLTGQQMRALAVNTAVALSQSPVDVLVCVLLAHGHAGDLLYGTNGELVQLSELAAAFDIDRCPGLIGKPKIFIVQACRGVEDALKAGHRLLTSDGPRDSAEMLLTSPEKSDYLYGFACCKERVAYRCPDSGSVYVQTLCKEIEKQLAATSNGGGRGWFDIEEALRVTRLQITQTDLQTGDGAAARRVYMVPEVHTTLRFKVVLEEV